MSEYDFEDSVGYWLTVTTQAYHRALQNELTPHGITFRQSQVIGWLMLELEKSQSDLAARMMIEPPTLVGILDRMERDGLIIRRSSAVDRRCKLVELTATAAPIWERIIDCLARIREQAMSGLTAQEQTLLKNLLSRVQDNLLPSVQQSVEGK